MLALQGLAGLLVRLFVPVDVGAVVVRLPPLVLGPPAIELKNSPSSGAWQAGRMLLNMIKKM